VIEIFTIALNLFRILCTNIVKIGMLLTKLKWVEFSATVYIRWAVASTVNMSVYVTALQL